jgi:hypothetical protein
MRVLKLNSPAWFKTDITGNQERFLLVGALVDNGVVYACFVDVLTREGKIEIARVSSLVPNIEDADLEQIEDDAEFKAVFSAATKAKMFDNVHVQSVIFRPR